MSTTIKKFIKIGKRENIEKLLYQGEIYMRHIHDFRKEEAGDFLRGDFAEGSAWTPFLNFRFRSIEQKEIKIENARINENVDFSHIYSLFMIDEDFWYGKKKISEKVVKFGDTALIINPKEFVNKVKSNSKYPIKNGIVKYYKEPLIPIRINEFSKRQGYEFQNEYRFVTKSQSNDPLIISIGSIEKIAMLIPIESLLKMEFEKK